MRFALISAIMAATTLAGSPVAAQSYREANRDYRENLRDARQDYRDDVRDARREYRNDRRDTRGNRDVRDWRRYRSYDYNHFEPGQRGYNAERYYRDGRYYQTRRLSRNDRIYRGSNGRFYCRRTDGTTGLIIGGVAGGLLGNALDNGRSSLLGTLIGAGGGALLGRSIDRGQVTCR